MAKAAGKAFEELGFTVPIMAQITVDQFNKMQIFNMEAAYAAVSGIGIDVFGINCTLY